MAPSGVVQASARVVVCRLAPVIPRDEKPWGLGRRCIRLVDTEDEQEQDLETRPDLAGRNACSVSMTLVVAEPDWLSSG